MNALDIFVETKQGKYSKTFIGIGASIVLLGALFKIQHWKGAGPMLYCWYDGQKLSSSRCLVYYHHIKITIGSVTIKY